MLFLQSFIVLLIILSTSMMYGLLIIFITLVVGCQPLDSASAVQSIKPTKQISILKFPIIPKQSSKDNNILKKVLSYDPAIELLTNKRLNLPQKWHPLNAQYHALPLEQQKQIQEFYKKNQYSSVWYDKQGILRKNAKKMQNTLNQEIYLTTPIEGDYIQISEKKISNQDEILRLDFAMTLNALFASDIIHNGITFGRLNIEKAGISQSNRKKIFNIQNILTLFNQNKSEQALKKLTNFNPQYAALKKIIERLIFINEQGGYVQIPQGNTIKVGQSSPVIPFVRQYLKQNGYVIDKVDGLVFDTYLEKLVKEFQKTRGINASGIIGSQTYKALNESVNTHIIAVIANFERIRRSSPYPSQKYIRVNVPETMLYLFDKHHNENLSMRAIVGRIDRPTPIFNDIIDYIDFNPYWNVPHSIATKDILPLLKKNSLYGQNKGIYIYQKNKVVNPRKINWKRYSEEYFPFSLRQEPGYKNALGTVKFIFPNKFAVYLHDTPSKNGFSRISRFLSSGCVRVQSPKVLANSLLHGQLSPVQINHIFKSKKNKAVYLKKKMPVFIEYLTAFSKEYKLHILPDIYQYDTYLVEQLLKAANSVHKLNIIH